MADEKILLADDEISLLGVLTEFLQSQGYAVRAVPDGHQALAAIKDEEFTLALLDLKLPGFSGLELLSVIKERAPETEVILFTGHAGLESAVQALRLGAYDYLLKSDLLLADLQAVIDRALERHRLAATNRTLLENLRQAQEELSRRRSEELTQIRRIGEALAGPLNGEQITQGMVNLIWESLPLDILALEFDCSSFGGDAACKGYRRKPLVSEVLSQAFRTWLDEGLPGLPASGSGDLESRETPLYLVWARIETGETNGVVAAARKTPFTSEESELFQIFSLQWEAAFKNLVLFEKVRSLAICDGLTGLYNYRYFWEVLHREVEMARRYSRPLSLLFLDIDDFKKVNDTLGHPVGDLVLKALAAYLRGAVRQADLVCRYGGEEFVVLMEETPVAQALASAERLRRGVSRIEVDLPEEKLGFTVSIGVAGLEPEMDGDILVQTADAALYRAKQTGKNRVCGPDRTVKAPAAFRRHRELQEK